MQEICQLMAGKLELMGLTNQSIIKDTFSISFDVASCYDMA